MNTIYSHSRKDPIVINIPTDDFAAAYFKILDLKLENSYVKNRNIIGQLMLFSGSIFRFAWNGWNLFNTISSGEIEFIEENGIPYFRHKIYFTETAFIALIFNIIPLFALMFEPKFSLFIFLATWILYFINYFVTVFRFNSYVSEVLIKVNLDNGYRFKTDIPAFG